MRLHVEGPDPPRNAPSGGLGWEPPAPRDPRGEGEPERAEGWLTGVGVRSEGAPAAPNQRPPGSLACPPRPHSRTLLGRELHPEQQGELPASGPRSACEACVLSRVGPSSLNCPVGTASLWLGRVLHVLSGSWVPEFLSG